MEMNILLGAGFSKSIFPDFPIMTELTEMALSNKEISNLLKSLDLPFGVFKNGNSANLEDWISILEESDVYMHDLSSRDRRRYLIQLIESFTFETIRSISREMTISKENIDLIEIVLRSKSNILTTNYDLILEYVVQELITNSQLELESPYGLNCGLFDYAFQRKNLAYLDGGNAGQSTYSRIFKLHGSCDWHSFPEEQSDKFWVDVSILGNFMFPDRKALSADSVSLMSPIRALPGLSKQKALSSYPMRRIWREAHDALKQKTGFAVFGSAVNPRDTTLIALLMEGLPKDTPIFVFDKDPDKVSNNLKFVSPSSNISKISTGNIQELCNMLISDN